MKVEAVFKNIAFKENVDVDKLMLKLKDLIEDKRSTPRNIGLLFIRFSSTRIG